MILLKTFKKIFFNYLKKKPKQTIYLEPCIFKEILITTNTWPHLIFSILLFVVNLTYTLKILNNLKKGLTLDWIIFFLTHRPVVYHPYSLYKIMLAAMLMPEDKLLRWPPLKVSSFCYLFRDTEELPTKPLLLLANWSMLNSPFGSCQTRELVEYTHVFCIMMENYSSCKHRGLLELNITIWLPYFGSEKTKKQSQYFKFLIFNIFFIFIYSWLYPFSLLI